MTDEHFQLVKALIAAQVALIEHAEGTELIPALSKAALLTHLTLATMMARKLKT